MKRVFYIALAILVATTVLGFWLQAYGVNAERRGPANTVLELGLSPALWPIVFPAGGLLLMSFVALAHHRAIKSLWESQTIGKAGVTAAVSLLFGPLLALMMQSFAGLKYYEIIDKDGMMTGLALLSFGFFLAMGNYMATANKIFGGGFNTPWTRKSDAVWRKTQRFLGRGIMVVTLFALVTLFFAPPKATIFAHIASVITMKVFAAAFSYAQWRRESERRAYDH